MLLAISLALDSPSRLVIVYYLKWPCNNNIVVVLTSFKQCSNQVKGVAHYLISACARHKSACAEHTHIFLGASISLMRDDSDVKQSYVKLS